MANANQTAPLAQPSARKSVTGFVTKLVGDGATYGFINDEIFFQQLNVTDGPANVNDRVFAECEYSAHLPIKWNATSIKILNRASSGPQQSQAPSMLDSDPRRQSRQANLLNQQSPVPVSQSSQNVTSPQPQFAGQQNPNVANTYQQHRQQRQHQQQVHEINLNQPPPPVMLDPSISQSGPEPFFSPFNQQPSQTHAAPDLQPFQRDTPMGPPTLEYTSQLGSAFVQNQFLPGTPLLPQQPPPQPLLPRQQTQTQQQSNQRDQRTNQQHNKNRFNDKNEQRNQNNRGRNRNDNKYEQGQGRSTDRDNLRTSRSNSSRDRSSGRGDSHNNRNQARRDETNSGNRQSPLTHANRSVQGSSSDRNHNKSTRRHYDSQTIPKYRVMSNLNGSIMRSRCTSSIHVPSDLKDIIVNQHFRLDIKNIPKPLKFKIDQQLSTEIESSIQKVENGETRKELLSEDEKSQASESKASADDASSTEDNLLVVKKETDKDGQQLITPPSSKSDSKLNHKYGVKVVLMSLPELDEIYKKIFGSELDSYTSESKSQSRLEESISLLCNKGSNGGHSLIGGKFDPTLDGFIEGETNELERFGKQPDLIATCRRVVLEQTGLDLGQCHSWTLVSTFLYNNKSDYFSTKASVEYSYIYMPHIWTLANNPLEDSLMEKESLRVNVSAFTKEDIEADLSNIETRDVTTIEGIATAELDHEQDPSLVKVEPKEESSDPQSTLGNLNELKVVDLKVELDKRNIKYKPSAKKADLVAALQLSLTGGEVNLEQAVETKEVKNDDTEMADDIVHNTEQEGSSGLSSQQEVDGAEGESITESNQPTIDAGIDGTQLLGKRKLCDEDDPIAEQENKKVCSEASMKSEKVELIREPFVVKAREGQQQLSMVPLYDVIQVARYDQFELSVTSHLLKEALVQHFSEYIFTTLVEDQRSRNGSDLAPLSVASSSSNSQETNASDSNNNSSTLMKSSNPTANKNAQLTNTPEKIHLNKEYPVDRYINLAFAYFDSAHMGYVHADDLGKLFNNTGLTISKRALVSLIGDVEKFNYRTLADLSNKFPPTYVYKFPDQFNKISGSIVSSISADTQISSSGKMVEYQGVRYDVEKLIQQVRDAETMRVNMVERFNYAIDNFDKQSDEIHVLEVSRMSLSKSIKALNDELTELKRERDVMKKKCDLLRKGIKATIGSMSELVGDEK